MAKPRNYGKSVAIQQPPPPTQSPNQNGQQQQQPPPTGQTRESVKEDFKAAVNDELIKISADRILIIQWVREGVRMEIAGMANLLDEVLGESNPVWNKYKRIYDIKQVEITKQHLDDLERQQDIKK